MFYPNGNKKYDAFHKDFFYPHGNKVYDGFHGDIFYTNGVKAYDAFHKDVFYMNGAKAFDKFHRVGYYENGNKAGSEGVSVNTNGLNMNLNNGSYEFRLTLSNNFYAMISINNNSAFVKLFLDSNLIVDK